MESARCSNIESGFVLCASMLKQSEVVVCIFQIFQVSRVEVLLCYK